MVPKRATKVLTGHTTGAYLQINADMIALHIKPSPVHLQVLHDVFCQFDRLLLRPYCSVYLHAHKMNGNRPCDSYLQKVHTAALRWASPVPRRPAAWVSSRGGDTGSVIVWK